MMDTSPLILVQFLKDSMLEALMAMVLMRLPTPTPSQAGGRQTLVKLLLQSPGPGVRRSLCTFGTRSVTLFTPLDAVLLHFVPPGAAGADTRASRHHVVIYWQTEGKRN